MNAGFNLETFSYEVSPLIPFSVTFPSTGMISSVYMPRNTNIKRNCEC